MSVMTCISAPSHTAWRRVQPSRPGGSPARLASSRREALRCGDHPETKASRMAGSVNKVILVGNVGRDPEIRNMQNGGKVAQLSVATSETWRDKNSGERQ